MKKNTIIGIGIAALLVAVVLSWFLLRDRTAVDESLTTNEMAGDPLDTTLDFYNNWLNALHSTSTDPYQSGLINLPILSAEVRTYIEQKHTEQKEGDLEPVLCQPTTPERVGGKLVYEIDSEAQIMMLARGGETKSPHQALATLKIVDGAWQISKIECVQGETGPKSEFDFERTGFLLKQSLQPPLDSQYWHLVYEENGVAGHTVPLFFNAGSICISQDGAERVCDPVQLQEAIKVFVQASMSEEGGTVLRMRFE